ncbi:DUF4148 domain-containing protein [Paraburkholderia solisilvae]|nr:DUF4148 domain-containing protein [Paraburkholderia solisilvae]
MKHALPAVLLISATATLPSFAAGESSANVLAQTIAMSDNAPKTHAQVQAELAAARAPGGELSMNPNDPAYPPSFATGGYTVPIAKIDTQRTAPLQRLPSAGN